MGRKKKITLYDFIRKKEKELNLNLKKHYEENKGVGICVAPSTIYSLQKRKPKVITYVILSQILKVDVEELKSLRIK